MFNAKVHIINKSLIAQLASERVIFSNDTNLDGALELVSIILCGSHHEAQQHLLKVSTQLTLQIVNQVLHRETVVR